MMKKYFYILSCLWALNTVFPQIYLGKSKDIENELDVINKASQGRMDAPSQLKLKGENLKDINIEFFQKRIVEDNRLYIGHLKGQDRSNVRISVKNHIIEGIVLDSTEGYQIYTDNQSFEVYLKKVNLNELVCTEFETSDISLKIEAVPGPASAVYKLQSNPASKFVAYLDFDGQAVEGTLWNSGNLINAVAGNFSETDIQNVFNLISEDYASFNINITTDESVYNAANRNGRMRCIFTPTNTASPGSGGVAYVGSFTWGDDTPCWVFNGGAKNAGEAASHEIGHTLGLSHDGRTAPSEGYFAGHGSWAPIMGVGYSKSIVQWSSGEYNNSNNKQDDISIITTKNGFSFKVDDVGNTIAGAKTLTVDANGALQAVSNSGIIEKRTDVDVWKFMSVGGSVSLIVLPANGYPNLDVQMDLLNDQGIVIGTSNPASLSASITQTLIAGTYYLKIDGVGAGDPLTNGYSDYSSIGAYSISGNIPTAPPSNYLPNINLVSPISGTIYVAPGVIELVANASDVDGSVTKVEFYSGSTKIGESLTSPYKFIWSNVAVGNYTITAKAIDDKNAVSSSSSITISIKKADCVLPNERLLFNKILGTAGSYNNSGYSKELVFDKDSTTFFDGPQSSGNWVGLELTKVSKITGIRFYPRISYASRMNGGKFQGSNTPDFSSGVVDLATVDATPQVEWNCINLTNNMGFKYVRYLSPNNGQCNVSEIEFYGVEFGNSAPRVTINDPLNLAFLIIPDVQIVKVEASDLDGTVSFVELYNDTVKLGSDSVAPFKFEIKVNNAQKLKLVALAIDNLGEYSVSDTVLLRAINPKCKIGGVQTKSFNVLGTTGSNNNSGNVRDKVFDGDSLTYFDSPTASSSWVGVDLGSSKSVVGLKFFPRSGYPDRMIGGRIQAASNATFTQGIVNIDTIQTLFDDEWNCISFSNPYNCRYIRYLSPSRSYGNVAELQLYLQHISPVVTISSLAATYNSIPAQIEINIAKTDGNGIVNTVDVYQNDTKVATLNLINGIAKFNTTAYTSGVYLFYVKVVDDFGIVGTSNGLEVNVNPLTTYFDNLKEMEEFEVCPNPAHGAFELKTNKDVNNVKIFDQTGKLVYQYVGDSKSFNLADKVNKGLYSIKVQYIDETFQVGKLILD